MQITKLLVSGLLAAVLPVQFAIADADGERAALARIIHELQAIGPLITEAQLLKPIRMPVFVSSMSGCARILIGFDSGSRNTSMHHVRSPGLSRRCAAITVGDVRS